MRAFEQRIGGLPGANALLDRFSWMNDKRKVLLRAVLGEGLCTFLFLFIVCATHVNHARSGTADSLVLGAISTGFCSIALIYSFADVSGAHFNPAVTFATVVTGKTSVAKGAMYVGIQLFAAVFSSIFVRALYPKPAGDGALTTIQLLFVDVGAGSDPGHAFVMEFMLTFILVYVIFATAFDTVDTQNAIKVNPVLTQFDEDGQPIQAPAAASEGVGRNLTIYTTSGNTKAGFAPLAIGMTLGFLCFLGGTVSGGAFNPARVFGPALVGGYWRNHWVYWFGDFLGAAAAGFTQSFFAHRPVQGSAEQ
ncbi:aquaporin-like protein [Catenaria anguillulae PL171]|uniref:Aquaporin-like protein n=1 Tax=Catenaria anguillulae PL171 TaxID=765915 RepID=A0A1Y2HDH4_9FUNG|nr:aquaporin-like protein [Catenaria anguillulae PL171]